MDRERRIYKKLFAVLSSLFFVVILAFFGVISFLDVDATVSESENRKLAEKPEFSFSALFGGTYTQDFENYYSDTFPMREEFMQLSNKITSFLTRFGGKEDNVIISYDKQDSDFVGEGVELTTEKSENENETENQETEKVTEKATKKPEKTTKKKTEDKGSVKGSILISGKRALEIFTGSASMSKSYASLVNKTASSMPGNVKFYNMLVPTAAEFYSGETYSSGVHSQKNIIKSSYSQMNKNIVTVDAYSRLEKETKEYIYFRTDHHWTARGAYLGYLAFCEASGNEPVPIDELETGKIKDFVGSLYNASNADVLKKNPDYVEYFKTRVDVDAQVYSDSRMQNGQKVFVVARAVNSDNKYLAFIGGDQPLERIVTSNKNGKKILVIKESYGNALVPFLCDNYEEVYVVDPRKTNFDLSSFVENQSIGEVLMINYAFAMSNETYKNALISMLK
ncbi:MAG: hypothetical protein IKL16_01735 [Clostridia bacterium]|nr:hypothetical protein [Clostridia bacterium]